MPFGSPYRPPPIPDVDVWQYLYETDRGVPSDKIILIDGLSGRTVTYGEHVTLARRFGSGLLQHLGWKKGDVLMVFGKNHLDSGAICGGVMYAGGTHTATSTALSAEELAKLIEDADAKLVVVDPALLEIGSAAVAKAAIAKNPEERVLLLGESNIGRFKSWKTVCVSEVVPRPIIDPQKDVSHIIYTSGSTGIPKGCMFTHRAVVTQQLYFDLTDVPDAPPEDARTVLFLPFFHTYGLMVRERFASKGLQVIVLPEFSLPKVCELVQRYKGEAPLLPLKAATGGTWTTRIPILSAVTWFHGTPPVYRLLLKNPAVHEYNLSSLKRGLCAGSVLPAGTVRAFAKRFHVQIKNALGMTEGVACVACPLHEAALEAPGSVGFLMPYTTGKVMDQAGNEVADGHPGRLFVKNPCVMVEYKNRPLDTAKALQEDGFVDSGDFVKVDGDGRITVLGRFSEVVRWGDSFVLPTDIEEAICRHPKVVDAAVVVLPGEKGPAADPRALVVLAPGVDGNEAVEEAISIFVKEQLEEPAWLRAGVAFVEQIPRSPAGKTLREQLKREFLSTNAAG